MLYQKLITASERYFSKQAKVANAYDFFGVHAVHVVCGVKITTAVVVILSGIDFWCESSDKQYDYYDDDFDD